MIQKLTKCVIYMGSLMYHASFIFKIQFFKICTTFTNSIYSFLHFMDGLKTYVIILTLLKR